MKLSKSALVERNSQLALENDVLSLALSDVVNGAVTWFGNSRTFSLGISRPTGAAGGIAIARENGMTVAFYFERYARSELDHIASLITGENTEYNRDLLRRRSIIEAAQAHVSAAIRAA